MSLPDPPKKSRRRTRIAERTRPCDCCAHPITQKHHWMAVEVHGENECSIPLCANCHELYHLIERAVKNDKSASAEILGHYVESRGVFDPIFKKLCEMFFVARDLDLALQRNSMEIVKQVADYLEQNITGLVDWDFDRPEGFEPVFMKTMTVTGTATHKKRRRTVTSRFEIFFDGITMERHRIAEID